MLLDRMDSDRITSASSSKNMTKIFDVMKKEFPQAGMNERPSVTIAAVCGMPIIVPAISEKPFGDDAVTTEDLAARKVKDTDLANAMLDVLVYEQIIGSRGFGNATTIISRTYLNDVTQFPYDEKFLPGIAQIMSEYNSMMGSNGHFGLSTVGAINKDDKSMTSDFMVYTTAVYTGAESVSGKITSRTLTSFEIETLIKSGANAFRMVYPFLQMHVLQNVPAVDICKMMYVENNQILSGTTSAK